MNKFDRAVNKKTSELITKNLLGQEVNEDDYKKYRIIARAMIREGLRKAKPNEKRNSIYNKTWKTASKYCDFQK